MVSLMGPFHYGDLIVLLVLEMLELALWQACSCESAVNRSCSS